MFNCIVPAGGGITYFVIKWLVLFVLYFNVRYPSGTSLTDLRSGI